jgi:hypothetical protein
VTVLQRLDSRTALLDVKGNVIQARFSEPVPDLQSLSLLLKSSSSGVLSFEMRRPQVSVPGFPGALFSEPMLRELEKSRLLQRAVKAGEKSLFGILRFLTGSHAERSKQFRALSGLLAGSRDAQVLSSLLSGLSDRESSLAALLLFRGAKPPSPESRDRQLPDHDMLAEALRLAAESAHPSHGFVVFAGDDGPVHVEWLRGGDFFACEFTLPALGLVEAYFRSDEASCCVYLSAEGDSYGILRDESSVLADALASHYPDPTVEVMRRGAFAEKILALAESMADNSFNVTA